MDVRQAAFMSLMRCEKENKFSNIELDSAIKKYGFSGQDRALFTTLVYGVIERRISLDYYIASFSSIPIEKLEPKILCILRLGFYQIIYLSRIPDSAACNESVKLAKLYSHKGAHGFVNAVMRALTRSKQSLPSPDRDKDYIGYLSIEYSIPAWLCKMWIAAYGESNAEKIMLSMCSNPKITLRTNTLRITRENLLEKLSESSIKASPTVHSPYGIRLDERVPVSELEALRKGLCFVQDEASQICASALGAMPGDTVLDCCACPGGKSFSLAMDMKCEGTLESFDLHQSKLSLISSGAEKLGITNIKTAVRNASKFDESAEKRYDRILCDVPCSGLGVIAKKPDLRHKSPSDFKRLPEIQYSILENSARYLKHGGVLVYSTCTLNPEENEKVVSRFLEIHKEFEPCGDKMPEEKPMRTIFPYDFGTDGFFIAKIKKVR